MSNCVDNCKFADENLDCHGQCKTENQDQSTDLNDADLERGASPHLKVIGDEPVLNGNW